MVWVVKLGGSLQRGGNLRSWVETISEAGRGCCAIVPGGGMFADAVRMAQSKWRFPDSAAHRMAVAAMEQSAIMLCAMSPQLQPAWTAEEMCELLAGGRVPVWMPGSMVLGDEAIPQTWDVTSDSLALRLAAGLQAEALLLVKYQGVADGECEIGTLVKRGLLDTWFMEAAPGYRGRIYWLGREESERLGLALRNGGSPGAVLTGFPAGATTRPDQKMPQTVQWSAAE